MAIKGYATKLDEQYADTLAQLVRMGVYSSHKDMLQDWTDRFLDENPQIRERLSEYNNIVEVNQEEMLERKERLVLSRIVYKYGKPEKELREAVAFARSQGEYLVGYQGGMYILSDGEPYSIDLIRLETKLQKQQA